MGQEQPYISHLRLQNVRVHRDISLVITPDVTLITGRNGSGKTSLLEALYIACRGTSFKGVDDEILEKNQPWYRIDVMFSDESKRTIKYDSERQTAKKKYDINAETHYRLPIKQKLPVVLFEPDDLQLLSGSPTRRRLFLDSLIRSLDDSYATVMRRYDRALRQRNSLLKRSNVDEETLFAWDVTLSEYGAVIIKKRNALVQQLNERITETYRSIAKNKDIILLNYSYDMSENIQQKLLYNLQSHHQKDMLMGSTSVGPHRHDFLVFFNNLPAHSVASRGENRTIILAMKFIEVILLEKHYDMQPLILLDDVFGELDNERQTSLLTEFSGYQIVIASVTTLNFTADHDSVVML